MAMGDDLDANVATAERLVRDAAAQGAQLILLRVVRGAVLLQGHEARALRPSPRGRRPPNGGQAGRPRRRAVRRPAGQHLRAGQPGDVQLRGHRRRRRLGARHVSQEPHPRRTGLYREVLLQPWRHRVQGGETQVGTVGAASAGTSGSPSRRAARRCSAPTSCYPTAIGSEPPDPSWDSSGHWRRHAGARRSQPDAAGGLQPDRPRGG